MKFPHPLALLTGCIALAAALTWVVPAGQYQRHHDDVTGREVVVGGTYHAVPRSPVTPFQAVVAIPRGMADASAVIFLVLLVGGAFVVVDRTGALRDATGWLADQLKDRAILVIPVVSLFFASFGALENMSEEIIALIPVIVLLMRSLGFDPMVAAAASIGAAVVGAAFSPINPFQVGIAQKLAHLQLLSGSGFRLVLLAVGTALWIAGTMRYARRTRSAPAALAAGAADAAATNGRRGALVLAVVSIAFVSFIYGVMKLGWDFEQMAALFFVMGVAAGLIGGLGVAGTAGAFAEGFGSMAYAASLIGFARAIFVVLDDGHIIDTLVYGVFTPIAGMPAALAALAMMLAQAAIHFPVPSASGQAVLTMPVLVPLSDLIGLERQVTVLAYQCGAGLAEMLTPTNGALMAVIAAAGVPYEKWLRFAAPLYVMLMVLGGAAVLVAIAIGFK